MPRQNMLTASLFAIIAAFLNALQASCVKSIGHELPNIMILFFRFGIGLLIILGYVISLKGKNFRFKSFKSNKIHMHLLRSILGVIGFGSYFIAIRHIPLVDALLLNITKPMYVPFIVTIFLGIPFVYGLIPGLLLGFVGVIFVLQPGAEVFQWYSLVGLFGAMIAAAVIVITRRLNHHDPAYVTLFYYFLFATTLLGLLLPFNWHTPTTNELKLLILIGLVSTIYQGCFLSALKYAPARAVTPLLYLGVVFGGILDWVFWGHVPGANAWIGTILVFMGAITSLAISKNIVKQPKS